MFLYVLFYGLSRSNSNQARVLGFSAINRVYFVVFLNIFVGSGDRKPRYNPLILGRANVPTHPQEGHMFVTPLQGDPHIAPHLAHTTVLGPVRIIPICTRFLAQGRADWLLTRLMESGTSFKMADALFLDSLNLLGYFMNY